MKTIEEFKDYSITRLRELRKSLENVETLNSMNTLAVYVCGSFGRLEAHANSDIDPFFVNTNFANETDSEISNISNLDKILLWADFIRTLRRLKFKELTRSGEYLVVHELQEIRINLGGPNDDFLNQFTARMLLLLESQPLYNNEAYDTLVDEVIKFYFTDYHDHEADFHAVFLLNDILRYWKTMCLNYEHRRNLSKSDDGVRDAKEKRKRAEVHLKNLKLKFSRLLICYSMVIPLAATSIHNPESIKDLVKKTPVDRIIDVGKSKNLMDLSDRIIKSYESFLTEVAKNDILDLIAEKEYRNVQFDLARVFSKQVYELLTSAADTNTLRYITI